MCCHACDSRLKQKKVTALQDSKPMSSWSCEPNHLFVSTDTHTSCMLCRQRERAIAAASSVAAAVAAEAASCVLIEASASYWRTSTARPGVSWVAHGPKVHRDTPSPPPFPPPYSRAHIRTYARARILEHACIWQGTPCASQCTCGREVPHPDSAMAAVQKLTARVYGHSQELVRG